MEEEDQIIMQVGIIEEDYLETPLEEEEEIKSPLKNLFFVFEISFYIMLLI